MASRARKKQAMHGGAAAASPQAAGSPVLFPGGFAEERAWRDEKFRRGVEARQSAMKLIDESAALKKRMEEVYEEGRKAGFKQAGWPILKSCIAAACIMLRDEFGMEEDDIVRGVTALHEKITFALEYSELTDEVLEKTGIELQLDDPLEAIQSTR